MIGPARVEVRLEVINLQAPNCPWICLLGSGRRGFRIAHALKLLRDTPEARKVRAGERAIVATKDRGHLYRRPGCTRVGATTSAEELAQRCRAGGI